MPRDCQHADHSHTPQPTAAAAQIVAAVIPPRIVPRYSIVVAGPQNAKNQPAPSLNPLIGMAPTWNHGKAPAIAIVTAAAVPAHIRGRSIVLVVVGIGRHTSMVKMGTSGIDAKRARSMLVPTPRETYMCGSRSRYHPAT